MRFGRVVGLMLAVCASMPVGAQPAADGRVPVLIGFRQPPGQSERAVVEAAGGSVTRAFGLVNAIAARIPAAAIQGLSRNPNVSVIEPDGVVRAHDLELDNTWGVKQLGAGLVHDAGNTGTAVKVCVLDTGIDTTHIDLYSNYRGGKDFVNNDLNPNDDNGHGTHTAGTVAAMMNSLGVRGVAPRVDLYIYKVLDANGNGNFNTVIAALQECVAIGGKVTSNSYGSSTDPGSIVKAAFDNAYAKGVVNVASAGNAGSGTNTVGFPAQYPSVMAVAAVDSNNTRAYFSSTGPAVEIAAPGVNILSTMPGSSYGYMSGTSMAAPHVAGLAALVVSCGITDPAKVRQRIRDTALDLGTAGPDQLFGYGVARADQAALNCGAAAAPVLVTDLSLGSLTAPSPALTAVATSVSVVVANTGNQSTSGFSVTLRDNNVAVGTLSVPALLAGANTTLKFGWTPGAIGTHTLVAALDSPDSNGANNSASATVQVIAPPTISLSVTTSSSKNKRSAELTWSGAVGANVTIIRSGSPASTITTANDGSYTDTANGKNAVNFTYKVCQTGTSLCSNTVAVTF